MSSSSRFGLLLGSAFLMLSMVPAHAAETYKLDPNHTAITWHISHFGFSNPSGKFMNVDGTLVLDEANPAASAAQAVIKAASLATRTEQREAHLKSSDFLEVEKYPELRFVSTKVEPLGGDRYRVTGDLTIRDVTKPVVLDVTHEGQSKDPWGGERMGFSATTRIDRRDFGLVWNQSLETGGVLVSNDIRCNLEFELVKAKA